MNTFYKTKNGNLVALIEEKTAIYFDEHGVLTQNEDIDFVKSNMVLLEGKENTQAEEVFKEANEYKLIEEEEGIKFYINNKSYKIYAVIQGKKVELENAESKETILKEKVKLKDFLKGKRKSKESFKLGDRVLFYGPTGTGKTYSFIEWLKTVKIAHTIVPVTEGMEDIDLFNKIVPTEKGVSYVPKEICNLLEKAEKGEKICIVFDEMVRGSNSFMNLVLKSLDPVDGNNYHIPNVIQDKTYVIPQENIVWGATINLGGKYTGNNALDEALFDRFNVVEYKGYDLSVEKEIIKTAIPDSKKSKQVEDLVAKIRKYHEDGEIRAPISTRGVKVWMEEFVNSGNLMQAFERTLIYRLCTVDDYGNPNEEELSIIKKTFKDIIS